MKVGVIGVSELARVNYVYIYKYRLRFISVIDESKYLNKPLTFTQVTPT